MREWTTKAAESTDPQDVRVRSPRPPRVRELRGNLTGTVPEELGSLSWLATLSLDNNALTGPLPQSLARLNRLYEFSYFNTGLCVPDDQVLRAWLESLLDHRGTGVHCAPTKTKRMKS